MKDFEVTSMPDHINPVSSSAEVAPTTPVSTQKSQKSTSDRVAVQDSVKISDAGKAASQAHSTQKSNGDADHSGNGR
jgi:hypothetical protein